MNDPTAKDVAQLFHETYERLAPTYGYRTREASAVPWNSVPDDNRRLMIATCAAVLGAISPSPGETTVKRPDVEVHRFELCPTEWQKLSDNGGDEDFVIVNNDTTIEDPYSVAEVIAERMDSMSDPQRVTLPDGRTAWITCHA